MIVRTRKSVDAGSGSQTQTENTQMIRKERGIKEARVSEESKRQNNKEIKRGGAEDTAVQMKSVYAEA